MNHTRLSDSLYFKVYIKLFIFNFIKLFLFQRVIQTSPNATHQNNAQNHQGSILLFIIQPTNHNVSQHVSSKSQRKYFDITISSSCEVGYMRNTFSDLRACKRPQTACKVFLCRLAKIQLLQELNLRRWPNFVTRWRRRRRF